jgi:hypothetical protein
MSYNPNGKSCFKRALTLFLLLSLAQGCMQAATADAAPSAQLKPILGPCLNAVLAPLQDDPKMPRVEIETLRATFAASQVTSSTPAEKNIYQNAMAVCDAMTSSMDARATARAAATAAGAPSLSQGGGVVGTEARDGWFQGGADRAIEAKQKDQRDYDDNQAKVESSFVDSTAYTSWAKNAPNLRDKVMNLFTKQVELEALYAKGHPSVFAPPAQIHPESLSASIYANSAGGYSLGEVRTGTKITFQYVGGKWKSWGHKATESPDDANPQGGDKCRLAIALPGEDGGIGAVIATVPAGTAGNPFVFQAQQDYPNLILRINSDSFKGPGKVQYSLKVDAGG